MSLSLKTWISLKEGNVFFLYNDIQFYSVSRYVQTYLSQQMKLVIFIKRK
jgi:hypothetical protein